MEPTIGLIGLGNVGGQLADALLAAGVPLHVTDLSTEAVERVVAQGAIAHRSHAELAAEVDVVMLSLPNSDVVDRVVDGEHGLGRSMKPGSLLIDMSTSLPARTVALAERLTAAGIRFLDAPISFGPRGIIVFVGGTDADYRQASTVFDAVSFRHYLVGPTGHGQHVKLLQNHISGTYLAVVAEVIGYGIRADLDFDRLREALRWTGAHSRMTERSLPAMLERDYGTTGTLGIHLKDLKYVVETGEGLGAPMPIGEAIRDVFQHVVDHGEPGWTQAALLRRFEPPAPDSPTAT